MNTKKNTWGGSRPGSGRKPTGRKKVMFYITTEEEVQVRDFIAKIRGNKK